MKDIIKSSGIGIGTCPKMHDHGECEVKLSYKTQTPLTFNLYTRLPARAGGARVAYEFYRESVHYWLLNAPGGSELPLGEATLRVRLSIPTIVCIRFPEVLVDADFSTPIRPMLMLSREWLQWFLADTYVALPAEFECDYLDLDGCITKILNIK